MSSLSLPEIRQPIPHYRSVRNPCAGSGNCKASGMPIPLVQGIVYGPVRSRRLGRSLGINVLPRDVKACNMDCAYCQYGWTRGQNRRAAPAHWPAPDRIEAAVSARLHKAEASGELIDRLTVAGHGEPTLHPAFEEIAERLCRLRDRVAPDIRLAILSNSTTAGSASVRRGLAFFDERYMKLDAGDPMTYARINGRGSFGATVEALRDLGQVTVQAMFVKDAGGDVDNTTQHAVDAWIDTLDAIQPARVQVYTIARPPAQSSLSRVPARRLREIAERVRALGIPADVYA
jgi:wyosine [tRNA(Phe)-imidazoG37] synthetase (radical SAM superfamily)